MTTDLLDFAEQHLLAPATLTTHDLERLIAELTRARIDTADLYFQVSHFESWTLEDDLIKEGSHSIAQGVGLRAISGDKTGFACCDCLELPVLLEAARNARAIAQHGQNGQIRLQRRPPVQALYPALNPLNSLSDQAKIDLLREVDATTRQLDPRIEQVIVTLSGAHDTILIVAQDGTMSADVRPLVRLNVNVIVHSNGRREQGSMGGGGRCGYEFFLEERRAIEYGREALRQALVNLEASEAPAGNMTVVLGPGWPGVLLHEAIGHGLEGDFNRKGTSAFTGRIGERVASVVCTVVDDGTLPGRRGSLSIDDEGTPTQCTVLIENGILRGYLQDKLNARLMNVAPTGNGRRESYAHLPIPRMTNTYMLPGEHTPEEIIASVERGLYAKNFGGGQVDITSGKFVFSASEAYWIEHGRITQPVKGATLIGNGPDVLTRVTMVGNDFELDSGVGTCGKDGQSVPVGVGQPTLRIDGLTVGGTRV